jgi:hypothetical protein
MSTFIFRFLKIPNADTCPDLHVAVFFWVLALDHDLRVATDIIGSVFVRNPAGTKVALWEEVAFDEGKTPHLLTPNAHKFPDHYTIQRYSLIS